MGKDELRAGAGDDRLAARDANPGFRDDSPWGSAGRDRCEVDGRDTVRSREA